MNLRQASLAAVRHAVDHGFTRDTGLRAVQLRTMLLPMLTHGRRRPRGWRIGDRVRRGWL